MNSILEYDTTPSTDAPQINSELLALGMPDPDLARLANSAGVIATGVEIIQASLVEGSRCVLPGSKRGARTIALRNAEVVRDRLNALIAELDGGQP